MSQPALFAAKILEASASALAGYAASLLVERQPQLATRGAMTDWKALLTQRTFELAAALRAGEPKLFAARAQWDRQAMAARQTPTQDLRSALQCLKDVVAEELPPSASLVTAEYLEHALEALTDSWGAELALDPAKPMERLSLTYLQAALEGKSRQAIAGLLTALDSGQVASVQQIYLEILLPVQREVGRMWHLNEVSVAEERVVSGITERAMATLLQRAEDAPATGKTVVAAAVAGNTHSLAVRMVADFFELAGWRTIFLSADVPVADVAAAVVYFEPDLLILSATLITQLQVIEDTIEAVRRSPAKQVKILVGGLAFAENPDHWQSLGADGYAATADAAVAQGSALVEESTG